MDQQQQSRRRPTGTQVLWIAIGVAGLFAAIVVLGGYYFEWKWTGYPKRTPWDWVDLLIVPIVLALGGYLFTRSENQRTQRIADERRKDDTLQAYLDGIAQLLTDKDQPLHRTLLGDNLSTVARARTLTVLPRLEGDRKARVVQFLYESGLIAKNHPVLTLSGADLRGANLDGANLVGASLHETDLSGASLREAALDGANLVSADLGEADLSGAALVWAKLARANLSNANLEGALLNGADLFEANLFEANLNGANLLSAFLVDATLPNTDLSGADLRGASLVRADLSNANLSGADLTSAEVVPHTDAMGMLFDPPPELRPLGTINMEEANNLKLAYMTRHLEDATMYTGQKYEDWCKAPRTQTLLMKLEEVKEGEIRGSS